MPCLLRIAYLIGLALVGCTAPPEVPFCEPGIPCDTASEEACRLGPEEQLHGRAAFVDKTCAPLDEATCHASSVTCAVFGQCAMPLSKATRGPCDAQTDRDFRASRDENCAVGTCIATSDADCRAATVCRHEGRCSAQTPLCVATSDADCKASALCEELGRCSHVSDRCAAREPRDCEGSKTCATFGKCALSQGQCVACERSEGCRKDGLCGRVSTLCRATSGAHCEASEACRTQGRCRAFQGACVR